MSPTADDFDEVRRLFARMAYDLDHGHAESYAMSYTEDGSFQVLGLPDDAPLGGKRTGHAALMQFAKDYFADTAGASRHWNGNLVFAEVSDTEMYVISYLLMVRTGAIPQPGLLLTSTYFDTVVMDHGRWKMKQRTVRSDAPSIDGREISDPLILANDQRIVGDLNV